MDSHHSKSSFLHDVGDSVRVKEDVFIETEHKTLRKGLEVVVLMSLATIRGRRRCNRYLVRTSYPDAPLKGWVDEDALEIAPKKTKRSTRSRYPKDRR